MNYVSSQDDKRNRISKQTYLNFFKDKTFTAFK